MTAGSLPGGSCSVERGESRSEQSDESDDLTVLDVFRALIKI